jgi:hypothetical protein
VSLKLGFFFRMDAKNFASIRQLRKNYSQSIDSFSDKLSQVNFLPLLEINEDQVVDFESCLNQLRKYTFLMNERELGSKVQFNSFSVFEQSQLTFTGEYNFQEIGEVLIDLKLLLENKFRNQLLPFSERFIEPSITALQRFSSDELENVLTELNEKDLYNFEIELVHFGYVDCRHEENLIVREVEQVEKEAAGISEYEFH